MLGQTDGLQSVADPMRRGRNAAGRLRAAVDMLPIQTKRAMLACLDQETIVTGAYTHDGGICPMLAAHRRGGRTDRESFARAWDRYTGAVKARRATEREIRALRCMLEASLLEPFDIHSVEPPRPAWSRLFRRWDAYAAAVGPLGDGVAPDRARDERPADHIVLPGRTSWIFGPMQAGEVESRKRTLSAR